MAANTGATNPNANTGAPNPNAIVAQRPEHKRQRLGPAEATEPVLRHPYAAPSGASAQWQQMQQVQQQHNWQMQMQIQQQQHQLHQMQLLHQQIQQQQQQLAQQQMQQSPRPSSDSDGAEFDWEVT